MNYNVWQVSRFYHKVQEIYKISDLSVIYEYTSPNRGWKENVLAYTNYVWASITMPGLFLKAMTLGMALAWLSNTYNVRTHAIILLHATESYSQFFFRVLVLMTKNTQLHL